MCSTNVLYVYVYIYMYSWPVAFDMLFLLISTYKLVRFYLGICIYIWKHVYANQWQMGLKHEDVLCYQRFYQLNIEIPTPVLQLTPWQSITSMAKPFIFHDFKILKLTSPFWFGLPSDVWWHQRVSPIWSQSYPSIFQSNHFKKTD